MTGGGLGCRVFLLGEGVPSSSCGEDDATALSTVGGRGARRGDWSSDSMLLAFLLLVLGPSLIFSR